jgi:hypothetical protein
MVTSATRPVAIFVSILCPSQMHEYEPAAQPLLARPGVARGAVHRVDRLTERLLLPWLALLAAPTTGADAEPNPSAGDAE